MNSTGIKSNWTENEVTLNPEFEGVTDNYMMFSQGVNDDVFGRLQIRLGKTKEELHRVIAALYSSL